MKEKLEKRLKIIKIICEKKGILENEYRKRKQKRILELKKQGLKKSKIDVIINSKEEQSILNQGLKMRRKLVEFEQLHEEIALQLLDFISGDPIPEYIDNYYREEIQKNDIVELKEKTKTKKYFLVQDIKIIKTESIEIDELNKKLILINNQWKLSNDYKIVKDPVCDTMRKTCMLCNKPFVTYSQIGSVMKGYCENCKLSENYSEDQSYFEEYKIGRK